MCVWGGGGVQEGEAAVNKVELSLLRKKRNPEETGIYRSSAEAKFRELSGLSP